MCMGMCIWNLKLKFQTDRGTVGQRNKVKPVYPHYLYWANLGDLEDIFITHLIIIIKSEVLTFPVVVIFSINLKLSVKYQTLCRVKCVRLILMVYVLISEPGTNASSALLITASLQYDPIYTGLVITLSHQLSICFQSNPDKIDNLHYKIQSDPKVTWHWIHHCNDSIRI